MTSAHVVLGPVVPVARLACPTDRFYCAPYRCTLSAADCGARQARARAAKSEFEQFITAKCRTCPDAAEVIARSGARVEPPPPRAAQRPRRSLPTTPPEVTARQRAELERDNAEFAARVRARCEDPPPAPPPAPEPPAATCAWAEAPGCDQPAARRSDCCPTHRAERRARRWATRVKAGRIAKTDPAFVLRALEVVERLGGIDAAEQLAAAREHGAGGAP